MDTILQSPASTESGATIGDFKAWLERAWDGELFVYHCGFLALGTNQLGEAFAPAERQRLAGVAHCAWLAAQQGDVHLLQRREGDACFTYLAVARPRSLQS